MTIIRFLLVSMLAAVASPWLGAVHGQDRAPARVAEIKQVWVNPRSSVYHCPGTRYWANTRSGLLMTEDDAVAKGHRPAYGRSCGLRSAVGDSAIRPLRTVAPVQPADTIRVWVNMGSGVFHCSGSRYYGATKSGRFLTQAEALSAGYRPAYRTPCG